MSNQLNKRNYHHQRNNGNDNNTRKNHRNQNRQPHPLAKLHDEILRSILTEAQLSNNEKHADVLDSYVESALSSSLYAINCAINTTTKVSPGAFVFQ